jgi:hypothetical protein
VRQAAERDLHALRLQPVRIERFAAKVDAAEEAGMEIGDRFILPRGDGSDLGAGMPEDDLETLDGGIPRPSEDRGLDWVHGSHPGCGDAPLRSW